MRGQMLLIVVLVMVVILTVGLSAATRTITNVRVSNDEENSERAFSAAEAGLEQALGRDLRTDFSGTLDNTSTYQTKVTQLAGERFLLNNNLAVLKDTAADVWLSTYPDYTNPYTGSLTVYWGENNDSCVTSEAANTMAALDIVVISGTRINPTINHYPVDPCAARRNGNNFANAVNGGGTVNGKTFAYRTTINVTSGLIARVIPLYASTPIGVAGCNGGGNSCNNLPVQGTIIESTGISENAQRKIITLRSYPKLPTEIFPFVLFSPN